MNGRIFVTLFIVPLLLSGCSRPEGHDPGDFEIEVPQEFSGTPVGNALEAVPEGTWFIHETFTGWIFFVQEIQTDGYEPPFIRAVLETEDGGEADALMIADPVLAKIPLGHTVLATSGFSNGQASAVRIQYVGSTIDPDDGPAWLLFAAFSTHPATLTAEFDFASGPTRAWKPAPVSLGVPRSDTIPVPRDGTDHRLVMEMGSTGSVISFLSGQPGEGAHQSFELVEKQPFRVKVEGELEDGTNTGAVDALGILSGPAGSYTTSVREETNPGSDRTLLMVVQPNGLSSWFYDTYGFDLHWDLVSHPGDQDFFED